ncbi:MAG: D-alanyl-D-alanine carboxypeptidase [Gammaproteobacteria bacterium]|nr:D-alanyl-D-alanine carboxypeptidase [Gammaproteobacteria bacterium]NNF60763.1 D-alanyl-D-alanine carboxypeptidase [Gammaproteobacteria bacterium]NNM20226.1 D-alanyl-D-alanine carboxypeptidase [Gammaproteobacteria bacterium]
MRTALLLLILIAQPVSAFDVPVPAPPPVPGTAYFLMDFNSGHAIASKNPDEQLEPASITKLMTAYIAFSAIANGTLALDEQVTVSNKAYRAVGSRMFIEERKRVAVSELLQGMIIQSGNDASIALAEHIAGSEETFAELMNQYAERLGLHSSSFANATGLPSPGHVSTPHDIAILAAAIIREYPEYYRWYSAREYTYNGITQHNRNTLLWRDDSVDGVKTGHTDSAGYCLVASAERDGTRLVAVVMGTGSEKARADATQALLNYGFRFFETHSLYEAGVPITTAKVWKGVTREVELGVREQIFVTIPRGHYESLSAEMDLQSIIMAPLAADSEVGQLRVSLGDELITKAALFPLAPVESGSLIRRAIDEVMLWFE